MSSTQSRRDEASGFHPSAQALDYRGRMRQFIDGEVIPREQLLDEWTEASAIEMRHVQDLARRAGLWAVGHPVEIGGQGLSFLDYVYVNEVIGRSEHGMQATGTHTLQDALMYREFGTPEQWERFIPPIVSGRTSPCFAMTEPEVAGSDPTLLETTAVLDGNEWIVNGHKWFSTWANTAAFVTVVCLTEPEADRHERYSMIVVPSDAPGYEMVRVIPTMGHPTNHCELRFTDVRVPKENLLGQRGAAFKIGQARLGPGRIYHCMRWLGQAQRAFELMVDRAKERSAFGSSLADKGEIQRYIAMSATEIHAARLMTLDAAHTLDRGDDSRLEISMVKYFGAQVLHDVIDRAIQVHGAFGVSDSPLQAMYRHARYARIYDGPDEVHRMVVSRTLVRRPDAAPWHRYVAAKAGSS